MKKRTLVGCVTMVSVLLAYGETGSAQRQSMNALPTAQRALLDQYCVTCHNQKLKTAGLMLDTVDLARIGDHARTLEKVAKKLRTGEMPPARMPRPAKGVLETLGVWLEGALDDAAAASPNPGRTVVHRLNRAEYVNSVRALLEIDTEAVDISSLLPADDSGYGFDNIGDVLSVSPMLLERYIAAAEKISDIAVGDPTITATVKTYALPKGLEQEDRMNEDLPFGSRGGAAIRHYFPANGEYVIRIRLQRTRGQYGDAILGIAEQRQLDVRLDGVRVKLFTVGGSTRSQSNLPADAGLEVRFSAKAGSHVIGVTFVKDDAVKPEGLIRRTGGGLSRTKAFFAGVGSVTVTGPYNAAGTGETPSRRHIFVCRPSGIADEQPCARQILTTVLRRAYRRPVEDADIRPLLKLFEAGRTKGGFEAGIRMALRGTLVSTGFLFRSERDPVNVTPNTPYRVSDVELASRLSFFLWSSIPDDELLRLAEAGRLKDARVLEQQVRRMLSDTRSRALVDNFAGQWLFVRNMRSVLPDPDEFPDFDENLRRAFQTETELFFESMLREDRSVLDLLNADYTFLNERLARHYQIPNIFGSDFRRVTLSDDARRGLLGQGSILTVTSYATRTSPTLRGKWVLENLMGTPPPPPPPDVPSLKDRGEDGRILSVRGQLEAHRVNPVCSSCHARMDPLGFALENFDAIGTWRTTSGATKTSIDSSGVLPDGTKFQGPSELRKILLSHGDVVVANVAEKLLTYALGRGAEYYDTPAIREIMRQAAPTGYRWSSLILGIVKSTPFQMRRGPQP